jgi:hypothetical protein
LDWKALSQFQRMPNLAKVAQKAENLFDCYFQISRFEYATAPFQWNEDFTEQGHFVNSFYWAASSASFRRAVSRKRADVANDDKLVGVVPPAILQPKGDCANYGEIVQHARALGIHAQSVELYDEHDVVAGTVFYLNRWSYFFRSATPVPKDDYPYAVRLTMKLSLLDPTN